MYDDHHYLQRCRRHRAPSGFGNRRHYLRHAKRFRVEWSVEDVECPLLPFVSWSSPSPFMYICLSVAYIRR